ncbi:hypothetical protein GUJ93_ZPchr0001g30946 [Zizania palustris]|uniref:Uncharacterized protein n=1 Tax=Zizania palustris TaxID=103762 RepID=A0A8J5VU27_ZIZPA|nr:hypothetical protein GUJ93_ZPchr0001g30946 [Zizania palustris]
MMHEPPRLVPAPTRLVALLRPVTCPCYLPSFVDIVQCEDKPCILNAVSNLCIDRIAGAGAGAEEAVLVRTRTGSGSELL